MLNLTNHHRVAVANAGVGFGVEELGLVWIGIAESSPYVFWVVDVFNSGWLLGNMLLSISMLCWSLWVL